MKNTKLQAALWYSRQGLPVFPVHPDTKKAMVKWKPLQSRVATPDELTTWFEEWPEANIGMACGVVSDVCVIDCDSQDAINLIDGFISDSLILPMSQTPKGGRHYYFTHTPDLKNWVGVFPKVDVRTQGGIVVLPPSSNGDKVYRWLDGLGIHQVQRPPMPQKLLSAILEATKKDKPEYKTRKTDPGAYGAAALANEIASLACVGKGKRNATLNRAAYSLGQLVAGGEIDAGQVETALLSVAVSIGLGKDEAISTIKSGLAAGAAKPRKCEKNHDFKRDPKNGSTQKKRARVQFI